MKIHRRACQAFHVRTSFFNQGFFNLCGAGVGHHGPLGHDSVQEVCFYPTTQDSFFYNPSAVNRQETRLTKRRRSNTGTLKRRMLSTAG